MSKLKPRHAACTILKLTSVKVFCIFFVCLNHFAPISTRGPKQLSVLILDFEQILLNPR